LSARVLLHLKSEFQICLEWDEAGPRSRFYKNFIKDEKGKYSLQSIEGTWTSEDIVLRLDGSHPVV
jgi:hypothetical protein